MFYNFYQNITGDVAGFTLNFLQFACFGVLIMTVNRFSILALGLVAVLSVAVPQAQAGHKTMDKAKPSLAEIEKTVKNGPMDHPKYIYL